MSKKNSRWKADDLRRLLARSETHNQGGDSGAPAVVERRVGYGALGKTKVQKADHGYFHVRVTSFRVRLLDEDNLCEKYHVDCCRYAGILPDDSARKARITTTQQKVSSTAEERIEIEIESIPPALPK